MTPQRPVSDELLNSFVDNELETGEQARLFTSIEQDAALKQRVCDLHGLKKMMQHAYPLPPVSMNRPGRRIRPLPGTMTQYVLGMLVLLLVGGSSGWMLSDANTMNSVSRTSRLLKTIQSGSMAQNPDKIIVQVSNANPIRLKAALDETENLLDTYRRNRQPLEVEILANGNGLDLLRSDVSPFRQRVGLMQARYPNLEFYACNQSIASLQAQGIKVRLLPDIRLAGSALEEINRRVRQGWDYVRT